MKGARVTFMCQECGYESPRWMGKCPACNSWNSFAEEHRPDARSVRPKPGRASGARFGVAGSSATPVPIGQVSVADELRLSTGIGEFDRVLGGGLVAGSIVLIGGDPGIGKSTILLQAAHNVASSHGTVLYVTGEESVQQVGLRAARLGVGNASESLMLLAETDVYAVVETILAMDPSLVVIDSIQTMEDASLDSSPGSIGQVRECTGHLMRVAKEEGVPVFLVGHVTKSGAIAGPKALEHVVDTVLYFEGDGSHAHRVVRAAKNRYGSTNEVGIFAMTDRGLSEVENPSEALLSERPGGAAGSVVVASMEGTRPLLVEVQALVAALSQELPGGPRRGWITIGPQSSLPCWTGAQDLPLARKTYT